MASDANTRKKILEIRNDEIKYYNQFVSIYISLTGRQPQPNISEECPSKFLEGRKIALKDEQETVDFYLNNSDEAQNQLIKNTFSRAASDEQNHESGFYTFIQKIGSFKILLKTFSLFLQHSIKFHIINCCYKLKLLKGVITKSTNHF
jgi:rubrerythrin